MEPIHIQLEVALRESDVVRTRLELFVRRLGPACLIWCFLAAVGIYVLPLGVAGLNVWAAAGVIAGPPVLLLLVITWNAKREYRAAANAEPMHYCFHDDGIDIGSTQKAGWIPWEGFSDGVETNSAFLIFLEEDRHYLIPKRCFANFQQAALLGELIASSIKR
ncbi:MAG: YcxB family protein [Acidobacteria bacterium]|nr:YcxB family protein [Acidobacteriota bacterium]